MLYDAVVIGGGIVGAATARELLRRRPRLRLALVEKEDRFGAHQSGRNSGVVHAGIYYAPGSLKARLCVRGLRMAYEYCDRNAIPYVKCGKLIVAVNGDEVTRLEALFHRGLENGVEDISLIDQKDITSIEPNIRGLKAIWSPHTGIVDWGAVTRSLGEDCVRRGAHVRFNFRVTAFEGGGDGAPVTVRGDGDAEGVRCRFAVTCGGLFSDVLARMTGCDPEPAIVPVRGEYLVLRPERSHLVRTNVYPVPHPGLPFLGVHITPRVDGSVWLGPNAVLAFHREGYRPSDFDAAQLRRYLAFGGFRKLARRHLLFGLRELYRGMNVGAQVRVLQRYLPQLRTSDVVRGPSGVRAQAVDGAGRLVDDFVFGTGLGGRVLHVRNAPSPAATSSLAIAHLLADRIDAHI